MSSLVVIGAQWGDEGKGKLVDFLSANSDWAVRFQGGNNAGHTLVVDGVKTKLSLVPSAILHSRPRCLIGAGVVMNPQVLLEELQALRNSGIKVDLSRLHFDRDLHLILPYHIAIDQAREEYKGQNKIGTTGRGIGPAYEHRAARSGVRLADLLELDALKPRIQEEVRLANLYLKHVLASERTVDFEQTWQMLLTAEREIKPLIANGSLLIDTSLRKGEKVVFEGAQGSMLDQVFGTIPFVTSSHTISGAVATGCGISPKHIDYVLGVTKAYSTRVGSGPFVSELHDSLGEQIRVRGAEFGTITGRPRRCGWLDAVALRRAVRLNGFDSLALTKLDVLSGLSELKICNSYVLDGEELQDLPALVSEYERVMPTYIKLKGWNEDISDIKELDKLPTNLRRYLDTISELVGCPISMISVSPERSSTIVCANIGKLREFI